jgi:hypothetical protein
MNTTTYTFDENILSDLHKDAYGFRPNETFYREWDCLDNDGKQDLWDQLVDAVGDSIREEKRYHEEAIAKFEERVRFKQQFGESREDVIRQLHDAYNTYGSVESLEFELGVPYGYLSGKNWG